jgi:DNA-binding NtrC family response regulator
MSVALQAKLLNVLQDGEFSRRGGKSEVRIDVRVVTATNRDLEQMVADGTFRQDLFFRLNVVAIVLPPLRERREEIPALADYFAKKYSVQYNKPHTVISPDTMHLFLEHDWPGNVRELDNLMRRAVVLGHEAPIQRDVTHSTLPGPRAASPTPAAAPAEHDGHGSEGPGRSSPRSPTAIATAARGAGQYALKAISRTAAREAERELILTVLQRTRWNRKATAEILGISYKALLYKIKENGLDKASS